MCSSLITVDVIEWLNSNGEVIASNENTSDLSLIFAPVNISINNQIYTCRVNKSASVNRTVVVSVTGKITINISYNIHNFSCNKQWKTHLQ